MAGQEEEEADWNSSKIKGFSFGDDDEVRGNIKEIAGNES